MDNRKGLTAVLLITTIIFFVELAGGFASNSLALLSDAGHMLTDIMALILALLAAIFALLPATQKRTFGFYRLEILSALFNGAILTLVSIFIFYESILRILHPAPIQSTIMLVVATIGFLANIGAAVILAGSSRENLNVRGAFLHVISDAVSSLGVIIGGVLIHFLGWYYADPILSILISILILRGAFSLIFESTNILLESAPKGINLEDVAAAIKSVKGVKDVHDLHLWSLTSEMNSASAHVAIADADAGRASEVLDQINHLLKDKYNVLHSTFQTECDSCPEGLVCSIEPVERHLHEHH